MAQNENIPEGTKFLVAVSKDGIQLNRLDDECWLTYSYEFTPHRARRIAQLLLEAADAVEFPAFTTKYVD